jgi:hypothetical protein
MKVQYGGRQTGSGFKSGNQQCSRKVQENFPLLLDIYVTEIIAEHLMHKGNCEIRNGRLETGSSYNFLHIIDRNATSRANTMFERVANTTERRPTPNTSCV